MWLEEEFELDEKEILAKTTNDIKVLKKLLKDEDACVRVATLDNPKITSTMVNSFMNDKNELVRLILSYHKLLNLNNILKLSKEKDPRYKIGLLNNPNTPIELKKEFLQEIINYPEFFEDLTELTYCPSNVLEFISKKIGLNYQTKLNLASHKNSNFNVLKTISEDNSYYVRLKVLLNPNCSIDLKTNILYSFKHLPLQKKENIIKYTDNLDILRFFARDKSNDVKIMVAKNQNTPYYTLDLLVKFKNALVIKAALNNQNIQIETLKYILFQDFKNKDDSIVLNAKNLLRKYGLREIDINKLSRSKNLELTPLKTKLKEIKSSKETSEKIKNSMEKSINDYLNDIN